MSCSFEKILTDVKNLTERLKNTNETTNKIIKDTSYFYVKLKSMNELQDKITKLSKNCNQADTIELSFSSNMENSNLERLRMENFELRELLNEYQTALELIMTRYRSDMNNFMHSGNLESPFNSTSVQHDYESQKAIELDLTIKYVELYKKAIESTSNAEMNVERLENSIKLLHSENEIMRNILGLIDHQYYEEVATTESVKMTSYVKNNSSPHHIKNSLLTVDEKKSSDHILDSFSDDDRCSVSSDASAKTLI